MARKEEKLISQESCLLLSAWEVGHTCHIPMPRFLLDQKEGEEGDFCSDSLVVECPEKVSPTGNQII